ncbi:hypothetical protein [Winogradskyella damuponensis]|uniref:Uncharacterized protein n=1 Tax=Winogradskyella damuponensis TaxID=943939 RepID=A0ABP8D3F5_9FLAO
MSENEKRIAELQLEEEILTNEMNDFFKRVQFSTQFIDSDQVSVKENIDFYYHKSLRSLNPKSDLKDVVLMFNDNMKNAMKNRIDGVDKIELKEYLKLILKLYNIGIEKEYLKLT